MKTSQFRNRILLAGCALAALTWTADISGYSLSGRTWGTSSVLYYVNPQNSKGLAQTAIVDALKRAADVWRDQTHANIELTYAGTTSGSSFGLNYKNEVFFRNIQSGFGAETYWWYDYTGRLVDFDTAFYEGSYSFYATPGTCTGNAVYLDDLAVHEFGHGLGLEHSSILGATMYPTMPSYCDTTQMVLEGDDIAGIESAYPAAIVVAVPSAPGQLAASVSSSNPTSSIVVNWADSSSNESGFRVERSTNGSTFSQVAQLGANATSFTNSGLSSATTYYYRVYAYNSGGNSSYSALASAQTQAVPVPAPAPAPVPPPPPAPAPAPVVTTAADALAPAPTVSTPTPTVTRTLTARGRRSSSRQYVDLTWAGFTASRVDVYLNGKKLDDVKNDGAWTDSMSKKSGTFQYKACNRNTSVCAATAVIF